MGVKINKVGNGIVFDASDLPGSGMAFAKKMFIPIASIAKIVLTNDKIIGYDSLGTDWDMDIIGSGVCYPIESVNGIVPVDLDDLFNKLIALI